MATRKNPQPIVFSLDETAALLGVCRRTVERRIADGTLRAVRFGHLIRIPRKSVDGLLESASK